MACGCYGCCGCGCVIADVDLAVVTAAVDMAVVVYFKNRSLQDSRCFVLVVGAVLVVVGMFLVVTLMLLAIWQGNWPRPLSNYFGSQPSSCKDW
jgi:hypothetical protein